MTYTYLALIDNDSSFAHHLLISSSLRPLSEEEVKRIADDYKRGDFSEEGITLTLL